MDTMSDPTLVQAVVAGRQDLFGRLVERHLPTVYAIASARLRNVADADDVAQETFLNAYRHLGSLREPGKFEAWVAAIARRTTAQHNKRRARDAALRSEYEVATAEPPSDASRAELHRVLHESVVRLRPIHREVVLLHYFAGKPTSEIASLLSISPAAVKKRLQRAREALGEDLLNRLAEDDRPKQSLSPLAKTIAAAISAETISWTRTAAAVSTAATLPKLIALGAVAAVGIIVAIAAVQTNDARDAIAERASASTIDETLTTLPDSGQAELPPEEPDDRGQSIEDSPQLVAQTVDTTGSDTSVNAEVIEQDDPLQGTLAVPCSVVFVYIHIGELLEYVHETYDLSVRIDARVIHFDERVEPEFWFALDDSVVHQDPPAQTTNYVTDGMYKEVDMRDVPLAEVLTELFHPMGLDYVVEPGFIWVSTPQSIATEVQRMPTERFDGYQELDVMSFPVSIVFRDIHLSEILVFMTDTYDVNFVWDHRVIQPPPSPHRLSPEHEQAIRAQQTSAPTSIVTDGMVPEVNLKQLQVGDALRGILRPLNLAYAQTTDGIYVSTPERIAAGDLPLATKESPERTQNE